MKKAEVVVLRRPLRFAEISDRRKHRKKILQAFLLFLGVGTLIVFVYVGYSFLLVRHVECKLDGSACETALAQMAQVLVGKSMFAGLSLAHPYLSVENQRVWPNGVRVQFRKPEILISFSPSSPEHPPLSLAVSGYLVPFTEASNLPPIQDETLESKEAGVKVGEKTLSFYRELKQGLKRFPKLPIQRITVTGEDLVELQLDQSVRAIAMQNEIGGELASLQAILLSPTILKEGKTIDLRFQNPVLK